MADLIGLVAKAGKSYLDKSISVDNWTFKMFYKATVGLIFACSAIVTSRQFFGEPISCDVGTVCTPLQSSVSLCFKFNI